MTWIYQHADVLSAFASVGLLVVWILYAQMFYRDYRRRRRPRLIIDEMSGPGPESQCVLTNLSSEVVYVERVLAATRTGNENERVAAVTERSSLSSSRQPQSEIVSTMRQGPIATGELIVIGSLRELAERCIGGAFDGDQALERTTQIEVRVIMTMSSENYPTAARKAFELRVRNGELLSRPVRIGTEQLSSRRHRRLVLEWLHAG